MYHLQFYSHITGQTHTPSEEEALFTIETFLEEQGLNYELVPILESEGASDEAGEETEESEEISPTDEPEDETESETNEIEKSENSVSSASDT